MEHELLLKNIKKKVFSTKKLEQRTWRPTRI